MASHLSDMGALTSAVMLLTYDRIEAGAAKVASDVSLARPLTGDATELNSALPEAFFVYQDELRKAATVLQAAAHEQSAVRVADAYGRLSETCVKCHATYREGRHPK